MIREWIQRVRNYPLLEQHYIGLLDLYNSERKDKEWQLPKPVVITYSAPTTKRLTSYVTYRDIPDITSIANGIVNDIDDSSDVDSCVLACEKWLETEFNIKVFKYVSEKGERWRTPEKTLEMGEGDCDDWGILLFYVIRKVLKVLGHWRSHSERLFCVVGNTNKRGYPDPGKLHFYLMWRALEDEEFYTLESTYFREYSIENFLTLPQKRNKMYGMIRWMWNHKYMYNVNSLWYN